MLKLLNVGFGNYVAANRVVAMVMPDASPIKRVVQEAREKGNLVDATCGRRTRSVIVLDSGHVLLSAIATDTINSRNEEEE